MSRDAAAVHLGYICRALPGEEELNIGLSRLGGSPVWSQQPSAEASVRNSDYFRCELCQGPLLMLGQFAAGYDSVQHRLLHVFVCAGKCGSKPGAWRVLRSTGPVSVEEDAEAQEEKKAEAPEAKTLEKVELPSTDDWGTSSCNDDWGASASNEDWGVASSGSQLDAQIEALLVARDTRPPDLVGGYPAPCAAPATAKKAAGAEPRRKSDDSELVSIGSGFRCETVQEAWPCYTLEIYDEPAEELKDGEHERQLLERYMKSELVDEDQGEADLSALPPEIARDLQAEQARMKAEADAGLDNFGSDDDEDESDAMVWMLKFQKRLERSPTQVVRYSWGGAPLWMSPPPLEVESGRWPPPCPSCGANRIFELQLLPTLLTQMRPLCQDLAKDLETDWGTVAIFTCANDCVASDPCEEFVVVQLGV